MYFFISRCKKSFPILHKFIFFSFIMSSSESTSNTSTESCNCSEELSPDKNIGHCCNNSQEYKNKKSNGLTLLAQNLRRGRSLNFTNKRHRKCNRQTKEPTPSTSNTKNKSNKFLLKFNCAKKEKNWTEDPLTMKCCVCTCYRRTEEHHLGAGVVYQEEEATQTVEENDSVNKTEIGAESHVESSENNTTANALPVAAENVPNNVNNSTDVYGNLVNPNSGANVLRHPLVDLW